MKDEASWKAVTDLSKTHYVAKDDILGTFDTWTKFSTRTLKKNLTVDEYEGSPCLAQCGSHIY